MSNNSKKTILVLDDDNDLLELLEYVLQKNEFKTIGMTKSHNIGDVIFDNNIALMIVDRNLPCIEGTALVKKLRNKNIHIPVIFLTAKDSPSEIKEGFTHGGDDYLTKPFDTEELILRVKAVLKRTSAEEEQNILEYRDMILDLNRHELSIENKIIDLTKLEFNLLKTLIKNKNVVLEREYLLEIVWNCNILEDECNIKTVNVAIKRLKEKIDSKREKNYIKSVRGIGYTLA
jgi:DNA-binding response OmpR family regulator